MGGPIAFRTAAAVPARVGAVASFHGGGLVTPNPNSPHLQAAATKAQFLVAIAENDDARSPNDKDVLKDAPGLVVVRPHGTSRAYTSRQRQDQSRPS